MHRRIIYQSLAWVPIAAGAANIAFATTSAQVINKSIVYEDRTSYVQTDVAVAETITADKWHQPLAQPTLRLKTAQLYELAAYSPFLEVAAETITVDKWWRQLDVPTRRRFIVAEEGSLFLPGGKPEANDQVSWHRQLDWPTRRRFIVAEEGSLFAPPGQPEARDAVGWHKPLNEPLRVKRLPTGAYQFEVRGAFPQVPWDWYAPLERPTRRIKAPTWQLAPSFLAAAPGSGTEYNWFQHLDAPTMVRRPARYTELGWSTFTPAPAEEVTIDKWWRELDRPTRRKLPVPQQIGYTFVAAAPGSGTEYNWFQQLDLPVRKPDLRERLATAVPVFFVPPSPGAGNEYNWWETLKEPVRAKRFVAQQQSLTVPPRLLTITLENGWFQKLLPDVVRLKWINRSAATVANINPIVQTVFSPLNIPRPTFKRTVTFEGRATYAQYGVAEAEVVTIDKWYRVLDRPTRRTKPVPTQMSLTFVAAAPGRGVAYNWFQALDTPRRRDQRTIAYQQFGAHPSYGLAFPASFAQNVTVSITVAFNRMLRYSCKAETTDGAVEDTEQTDAWVTQSEQAITLVDESEQADPWSTETEVADTSTDEDEEPGSGCL